PAQPAGSHPAVRGREHRPVRAVHASGRELPGLRLRPAGGLLRDDLARVLHRGHGVQRQEVLRFRHRREQLHPRARARDVSAAPLRPLAASLDVELPYPSRRVPTMGRQMVATSQPLAAQAGLAVLAAGGNAVDAAIAAAAVLTVVEPTMNGIGSDAFALVWDGQRLHGLNGSGRAPAAHSLEAVRAAGHSELPARGWLPVTVPGAPAAWRDLHARFGRLPFADL